MRALVAAGERAARSWAWVGCGARGTGDGVAVVRFMDVVEDGGGRGAVVREGAIIACVYMCRSICISYPPLRRCTICHASSVRHVLLCSRSVQLVRVKLGVYLCFRCVSWPSRLVSGLIELRRVVSCSIVSLRLVFALCLLLLELWSSSSCLPLLRSFLLFASSTLLLPSVALSLLCSFPPSSLALSRYFSFAVSLLSFFALSLLSFLLVVSSFLLYRTLQHPAVPTYRVVSCRRCQNKKLPYRGK